MQIALVYKSYLPSYGGIEVLMHTIAKGLKEKGCDVTVITLNVLPGKRINKLPEEEFIDGIRVLRLKSTELIMSQIDYCVETGLLKNILRECEIVHVFSSLPSAILYKTLSLCRKLKLSCVWQPIFITNRFKYHKNPFVRSLGNIYDEFILPVLARKADVIVSLTEAETNFFKEKVKVPVFTLGECVEMVHVSPRIMKQVLCKYKISCNRYILSVGRIVWYKGYDLLLHSWRFIEPLFENLKLVIIGRDYGYKKKLLEIINKYKVRNVLFLDPVSFQELHALYQGCLFVVSLSRFETFHRIALEAWVHRKPIIALDLGPATKHIAEARGGILVNEYTPNIILSMKHLIEDRDSATRMGIRGYTMLKQKYTVDIYVKKLLAIYRYI